MNYFKRIGIACLLALTLTIMVAPNNAYASRDIYAYHFTDPTDPDSTKVNIGVGSITCDAFEGTPTLGDRFRETIGYKRTNLTVLMRAKNGFKVDSFNTKMTAIYIPGTSGDYNKTINRTYESNLIYRQPFTSALPGEPRDAGGMTFHKLNTKNLNRKYLDMKFIDGKFYTKDGGHWPITEKFGDPSFEFKCRI